MARLIALLRGNQPREVFMRTRDELAAVIARDLLGNVMDDPARYGVSLLSVTPKLLALADG